MSATVSTSFKYKLLEREKQQQAITHPSAGMPAMLQTLWFECICVQKLLHPIVPYLSNEDNTLLK